jgi:hypothetical protein
MCPQKNDTMDKCLIDESKNILGPFKCNKDYECKGSRVCTDWGWCYGDSNCTE